MTPYRFALAIVLVFILGRFVGQAIGAVDGALPISRGGTEPTRTLRDIERQIHRQPQRFCGDPRAPLCQSKCDRVGYYAVARARGGEILWPMPGCLGMNRPVGAEWEFRSNDTGAAEIWQYRHGVAHSAGGFGFQPPAAASRATARAISNTLSVRSRFQRVPSQ